MTTTNPTANMNAEAIIAKALRDSWTDELEYTEAPEDIASALRAHGKLAEGAPSNPTAGGVGKSGVSSNSGWSEEQIERAAQEYHERGNGEGSFDRMAEHVRVSLLFRMGCALTAAGVATQEPGEKSGLFGLLGYSDDDPEVIQARAVAAANDCPASGNHRPVQHRDGKPPWCNDCGLTAEYAEPVSRLKSQDNKWACGKCAREVARGGDDGQIPEHHRTCPKRESAPTPDREKLAQEVLALAVETRDKADRWANTLGEIALGDAAYADAELLRQAADALASPPVVEEEKLAQIAARVYNEGALEAPEDYPLQYDEAVQYGTDVACALVARRSEWLGGGGR